MSLATIEGDDIVIRISADILVSATQGNPSTEHFDLKSLSFCNVEVTDVAAWRLAVAEELNREAEDGTTPVHKLFDAVLLAAIESGADGIRWPDDV